MKNLEKPTRRPGEPTGGAYGNMVGTIIVQVALPPDQKFSTKKIILACEIAAEVHDKDLKEGQKHLGAGNFARRNHVTTLLDKKPVSKVELGQVSRLWQKEAFALAWLPKPPTSRTKPETILNNVLFTEGKKYKHLFVITHNWWDEPKWTGAPMDRNNFPTTVARAKLFAERLAQALKQTKTP